MTLQSVVLNDSNPEEGLCPFPLKTMETRELTSSEIWQEVFGKD